MSHYSHIQHGVKLYRIFLKHPKTRKQKSYKMELVQRLKTIVLSERGLTIGFIQNKIININNVFRMIYIYIYIILQLLLFIIYQSYINNMA